MKYFAQAIAVLCFIASAAYAQQEPGSEPGATTVPAGDSRDEILLTFRDRSLERTSNTGPGHYRRRSSHYDGTTWSRSIAAELARDYPLDKVLEWPIRSLGVHCVVYRVDAAQSADVVIAKLRSDRRVKSVQYMNTFHSLGSEDPYKPLQTSFNEMQIDVVHRQATGAGIRIAIIDSGVDARHPDLAGQVTEQIDLTGSALNFEEDIHGTAVAGIIAARSENGLGIEGVAPGARLLALRACWPQQPGAIAAVCNSLTLARALDTAILLKTGIVNLSLTGPPDPLIGGLLRVALRDGIIVVAAEPEAASSPGFIDGIDGVIRVRAGGRQDAVRADWREVAAIMAPGSDLLTTFPRGSYNFASGSSFAAANVSGIIALLLELQPGLTAQQVEELLLFGMGETTTDQSAPVATSINACIIAARIRPDLICVESDGSELLVNKSREDKFGI